MPNWNILVYCVSIYFSKGFRPLEWNNRVNCTERAIRYESEQPRALKRFRCQSTHKHGIPRSARPVCPCVLGDNKSSPALLITYMVIHIIDRYIAATLDAIASKKNTDGDISQRYKESNINIIHVAFSWGLGCSSLLNTRKQPLYT